MVSVHTRNKAKFMEKEGKLLKIKKRRAENKQSEHLNKDEYGLDVMDEGEASGHVLAEVKALGVKADSSGVEEAHNRSSIKIKELKKTKQSKKKNDLHPLENGFVGAKAPTDIADYFGVEEAHIGESIKIKKVKRTKKSKRKHDLHPSQDCFAEAKSPNETADSSGVEEAQIKESIKTKKVKRDRRSKKKNDFHSSENNTKKVGKRKRKNDSYVLEKNGEMENVSRTDAVQADEISLVDEDCSRGMRKWLIDYKERRPGLKILQERIDEFITIYEEQKEQERKEREARATEGGWTVVVHHKGRKKTTEAESGITVGSVGHAAVLDNMAKKKKKEVPLDFYRFQKREAQRSEVMMLQSKFEQDKKRIQQLRAARKFRPY